MQHMIRKRRKAPFLLDVLVFLGPIASNQEGGETHTLARQTKRPTLVGHSPARLRLLLLEPAALVALLCNGHAASAVHSKTDSGKGPRGGTHRQSTA